MCVGQKPRLWAVQRIKTYSDLFSNFFPMILGFSFTYDISTSFDQTNNMKLLNAKATISTFYIFEGKKWMNSQPHLSTSIPLCIKPIVKCHL
jgi:hypothetical protein